MKSYRPISLLWLVVLTSTLIISCGTAPASPPTPPAAPLPSPSQAPTEVTTQPPVTTPLPQPTTTVKPSPTNSGPDLSYLIYQDPANVDNSNLPITPVGKLGITGTDPKENIAEWRLTVSGLVETPLSLTYQDILAYPTVTQVVLLICAYTFADNAAWTGVPVSEILAKAGVKPGAKEVTFYGGDDFNRTLSLEKAGEDGVFLAHTVNGQILPPQHGYPLRLVVKGYYGAFWVKWVERIEVS